MSGFILVIPQKGICGNKDRWYNIVEDGLIERMIYHMMYGQMVL